MLGTAIVISKNTRQELGNKIGRPHVPSNIFPGRNQA